MAWIGPMWNRGSGALDALPDVDVRLYAPGATPDAAEMANATTKPRMSVGRAALVTLVDRYSRLALAATPIEVQKLMYFLQVLGEPLRLNYAKNLYGPYADNLRHVLDAVEGHYLTGYGDGSARVLEAVPVRTLPEASEAAAAVLARHSETLERIDRVMDVIGGFESMYGMELLATVHWATTEEPLATNDWHRTVDLVHQWSPRKKEMFTDEHICVAWTALRDRGLIPARI